MLLFQDKSKQNEKTLGASNGTFTLEKTLEKDLKLVMNYQKK